MRAFQVPLTLVLISVPILQGQTVQHAVPLSVDTLIEFTRTLPDGNIVHTETHGKYYRDGQGRQRTESDSALGEPKSSRPPVVIDDPVAQTFTLLNSSDKTARVRHRKSPKVSSSLKPIRFQGEPNAPEKLDVKELGFLTIEGYSCRGRLFTRTIAAGAVGNPEPIVTTDEQWISPDLEFVLLKKVNDPLRGQHKHTVFNIRPGEPDPVLFRIPADYTVQDEE